MTEAAETVIVPEPVKESISEAPIVIKPVPDATSGSTQPLDAPTSLPISDVPTDPLPSPVPDPVQAPEESSPVVPVIAEDSNTGPQLPVPTPAPVPETQEPAPLINEPIPQPEKAAPVPEPEKASPASTPAPEPAPVVSINPGEPMPSLPSEPVPKAQETVHVKRWTATVVTKDGTHHEMPNALGLVNTVYKFLRQLYVYVPKDSQVAEIHISEHEIEIRKDQTNLFVL